jgi:hypothetical protein
VKGAEQSYIRLGYFSVYEIMSIGAKLSNEMETKL